jgi:hypothetical protein
MMRLRLAAHAGVATLTLATLTLATLALATACERAKPPAPVRHETSVTALSPLGREEVAATSAWNDEIGSTLATPSLEGVNAVMFERDTTGRADRVVELFTHDDHTVLGTLHVGAAIGACALRRSASISLQGGKPAAGTWALALDSGVALPVGVDALGDLSARDSAALVARISALVSAVPEDSASGPFRGLPIVVRDAWRFVLPDSTPVAVAIAMRTVNMESNPRAQAFAMVAEPDPSTAGQWRTAFTEVVAGLEDRVEGLDLLAVLRTRGSTPALALVREGDTALQVEIVQRVSPGRWSVRWSSSAIPCPGD